MEAKKVKHICVERHSLDCRKEWFAYSVESEPVYTICDPCYEYDCQNIAERAKSGD